MGARPYRLPRDASLGAIARAPMSALRDGHRIRLGLADGRMGLWHNVAPPCAPLFSDALYWRAYAFAASAWQQSAVAGSEPEGREPRDHG